MELEENIDMIAHWVEFDHDRTSTFREDDLWCFFGMFDFDQLHFLVLPSILRSVNQPQRLNRV